MSATILESLSNRKLIGILSGLLIIQLIAFYVGAFLTPPPSAIQQFTATRCFRKERHELAIPRHHKDQSGNYVLKNCKLLGPVTGHRRQETFHETTFAVQLPLPRDNMDLAYSRWMQTLLVILSIDFHFVPLLATNGIHNQQMSLDTSSQTEYQFPMLMDVDLAVKNSDDADWTLYAKRKNLKRTINCHSHDLRHNYSLDCEQVQLFELQSLHYEYYLINFEIKEDPSSNKTFQYPIGLSEDIIGVAIHHNGGFSKRWILLKTICFISTLATLVWYYRRLSRLNRKSILIERLLTGLGSTLTILNAPVEFLTLVYEVRFMTFLNDLRQGMFYCILFSFWIIFFGEHLQDGTRKDSKLASYGKELLAIFIASMSLLIFDLSERGIQTFDPFLTIWESKPNLANVSICTAIGASIAYLSYLAYYIYLAYCTISGRQLSLPKMQITKRLKYQGIIYRFKFLLSATVVCAMSTFAFYAFSQKEDRSQDEDSMIEWRSAMLVTVSTMWNLYVIILMILYAPSYKGIIAGVGMTEQIEFDCLTDDRDEEMAEGDMKLLQELANKANLD